MYILINNQKCSPVSRHAACEGRLLARWGTSQAGHAASKRRPSPHRQTRATADYCTPRGFVLHGLICAYLLQQPHNQDCHTSCLTAYHPANTSFFSQILFHYYKSTTDIISILANVNTDAKNFYCFTTRVLNWEFTYQVGTNMMESGARDLILWLPSTTAS